MRTAQTKSSQLYKNMTTEQVAAWTNYAATLPQVSKRSGRKIKVSAINAFCALADKFLQVTPAGTVPMTPPSTAFTGDTVAITATAGTGQVTFTSSGQNAASVRTELLQPLKSKNRTPQAKGYRTKAFIQFLTGSLSTTVTVPTGYYAAAYRFVHAGNGQATAIVPLTVLTVALSVEDGGADEARSTASRKKAA